MSRNVLPFVCAVAIVFTACCLFRGPSYPLPNSPPDSAWTTEFLGPSHPLENVPQVVLKKMTRDGFEVTVKNTGTSTLVFSTRNGGHVQLFQEVFTFGRWTATNWDWCGTGLNHVELKPGETIMLHGGFWNDTIAPQRMLTNVIERENFRSGLVVLAAEDEIARLPVE